MNPLQSRILEISKAHGLSHLGSCLTAVGIIDKIYSEKKEDEPFVLSSGHAGLALYVVLEKYYGLDAERLFEKHGVHPNRDLSDKIFCSTGSLGCGLTIAVGLAFADKSKNVYCLISDGETYEGTIWEVANVMRRYGLNNLKVYVNWNGWSAYHEVESGLINSLMHIMPLKIYKTNIKHYGFQGLEAHYKKAQ